MGRIATTIGLSRLDKDFNLLEKRVQPSRSWTRHFFENWYVALGYGLNTLANIRDVFNNLRTLGPTTEGCSGLQTASAPGDAAAYMPYRPMSYFANYGTMVSSGNTITGEYLGIVVGSNNAAVTPTDSFLGTRIAHGSGAGQLLYGGCEVLAPTFADPNGAMIIRRYFTNISGGDVSVLESGIYSPAYRNGGVIDPYCTCHDVFAAVVVATTELLVVTYTAQITV